MAEPQLAYIGLGANIAPAENLALAAAALRQPSLPGDTRLVAISNVWRSAPLHGSGPTFLNAAAALRTRLEAADLKAHVLRPREAAQGRVRSADRNAPRPLDLDLLVYAGEALDPEIWLAAHIAVPLSELLPDLTDPHSGQTLQQLAQDLRHQQQLQPVELTL
ncbi:MAG: 2-amino-4-hydroxy-6-hydroxymethyldihydropteridine diphosphokinase [Anaerolineales bacterium]|nr:2-amino-4-hydroxy-6-hydroxymethyldihydropteridine diphosphokinase [Anaerolineales bacterium]